MDSWVALPGDRKPLAVPIITDQSWPFAKFLNILIRSYPEAPVSGLPPLAPVPGSWVGGWGKISP